MDSHKVGRFLRHSVLFQVMYHLRNNVRVYDGWESWISHEAARVSSGANYD